MDPTSVEVVSYPIPGHLLKTKCIILQEQDERSCECFKPVVSIQLLVGSVTGVNCSCDWSCVWRSGTERWTWWN